MMTSLTVGELTSKLPRTIADNLQNRLLLLDIGCRWLMAIGIVGAAQGSRVRRCQILARNERLRPSYVVGFAALEAQI